MGMVIDQAALDAYRAVLLTLGNVTGYIQWKPLPLEWLYTNIPNTSVRLVHQQMIAHICEGGTISQVKETRPEYVAWRFHYDLRLPISNRRVYLETVFLHEPDLEDCAIWVVNMHDV